MDFIDFFAGVGGFRRGMELAGHRCVGFCEWDKYAAASYTSMHLITDEQREFLASMPLNQRQKEILKEEYRNGEYYCPDVQQIKGRDLPHADCYCFGAPCQDFSLAGKRKGLAGERSCLVGEVYRIVAERGGDKPEWLIYENVKGMFSSNRGLDYFAILAAMDELGYDAEWQLLNTSWFLPQNRERVYTVGHLRAKGSKKVFPVKIDDRKNHQDNVDDHLIIIDEQNSNIRKDGCVGTLTTDGSSPRHNNRIGIKVQTPAKLNVGQQTLSANPSEVAGCILSRCYKGPGRRDDADVVIVQKSEQVLCKLDKMTDGHLHSLNAAKICDEGSTLASSVTARYYKGIGAHKDNMVLVKQECLGSVDSGRSPEYGGGTVTENVRALSSNQFDKCAVIKVKEATKQGFAEAECGKDSINLAMPDSETRRGRVGKNTANTLDCACNQGVAIATDEDEVPSIWSEKYGCNIAIRKLTPRECFRLQGWTDEYFDKAAFVNSDSQLYKQAGNGVTVDVVRAVAIAINEATEYTGEQPIVENELQLSLF